MKMRKQTSAVDRAGVRLIRRLSSVAALTILFAAAPMAAVPASASGVQPSWHDYKQYQLTDSISQNAAIRARCNTDGRAWENAYYLNPTYTHYQCATVGQTLKLRVYI